MMRRKTPASLFARIFWMQVGIGLGLAMVFGVLFYMERNRTVARLLADRWAPVLRQAAALPEAPADHLQLQQSRQLPGSAILSPMIAPRMVALLDELRDSGVPVKTMALQHHGDRVTVWLEVVGASGQPGWLGFDDTRFVEPDAGRRVLLALALGLTATALASWHFARRIARPLAQMQERMHTLVPGPAAAEPPLAEGAPAELIEIDAAWRAMRTRLARHEHERDLLLAGVSHDLRSPLTRIRMAAALLPEQPDVQVRRDVIVRNVQAADRLIDDFLDHVRFGTLPLNEAVDLVPLARRLAAEHEGLQLQAPARLVLAQANGRVAERVLANLVDNACKHGRPPVQLRLLQEAGQALIEVADAGPGIAEDQREHLVHAFARGDASRGTSGSGLGLAIVVQAVERMQGSLGFEQGAGGGFTVRLRLPLGAAGA